MKVNENSVSGWAKGLVYSKCLIMFLKMVMEKMVVMVVIVAVVMVKTMTV